MLNSGWKSENYCYCKSNWKPASVECYWWKETASAAVTESTDVLWHRHYGRVRFRTLEIIATNHMVDGFDYQKSSDEKFCEPCIDG